MKNFVDFKLGDKKLSDLHGVLYTEEKDKFNYQVGRVPNHKTFYVQGKGNVYYGTSYGNIELNLPCYFEGELDEAELIDWLVNVSGEQRFQFVGDDKYCYAVYNGMFEVTVGFKEGKKYNLVNIPLISFSGWLKD